MINRYFIYNDNFTIGQLFIIDIFVPFLLTVLYEVLLYILNNINIILIKNKMMGEYPSHHAQHIGSYILNNIKILEWKIKQNYSFPIILDPKNK